MCAHRVLGVALLGCALAAQGAVVRPTRFFDAGRDNQHRLDLGVISFERFGEKVRVELHAVTDFVFRPADHYADGTAEGTGADVSAETIGFPLELWSICGSTPTPVIASTLPKEVEDLFAPDHFDRVRLLRLGVEHSVAVGVRRAVDGTITAFVGQDDSVHDGQVWEVSAAELDARLPAADPRLFDGWCRERIDGGIEDLPEPLRAVRRASPEIPVVDRIDAEVEDTYYAADGGTTDRFVFEVKGAVAADGRFALERAADHRSEDDTVERVVTEISCDLRALYVGVGGWPLRCVWPSDHRDFVDVLRTQAGVALPILAWARDPYWCAPSRLTRFRSDDRDPGLLLIDEDWPETGLPGLARYEIDQTGDVPRVLRIGQFRDQGTSLRLTVDFDDERELAPGFRRPMRVTTRWFAPGSDRVERERVLRIRNARIAHERGIPNWRLAGASARFRRMR